MDILEQGVEGHPTAPTNLTELWTVLANVCKPFLWNVSRNLLNLCLVVWQPLSRPEEAQLVTRYSPSSSLRLRFESQPPPDLRKSNFFNFRIEVRTEHGLADIIDAKFRHYLNEGQIGNPRLRNGIKYSITVRHPNETTETKDLYLMLVDAATQEPIQYEGHDGNPKMKRVLLTHETICTRCSLNKSCGNKNEAPSDPGITSRGVLKFFLKCNQNCLKGAGNPRDMRRFSLAVSFDDMTFDKRKILAVSSHIFVHNNSKHSRKRRREEVVEPRMRVFHLSPCGDKVTVVGEHFRPGTRVFINNESVLTTHLSDHVIEAWVPPAQSTSSPAFKVSLQQADQFLDAGHFINVSSSSVPIACVSPVLGVPDGELHFVSRQWAVPGVSFVCGDMHLPVLGMVRNTAVKVLLPFNVPSGFQVVTVLWNNRVQFTFPYLIQDRQKEGRGPHEYLCLHRKGVAHYEVEPNNLCVHVEDDVAFDRSIEWAHYFRALSYYESSGRSYASSSPDGLLHTSSSEHSPTL